MKNRGKLYIIPDENQIMEEEFMREVRKDHLDGMREFSDKYQLGYNFVDAAYQEAPCILASLGHMVVKTDDEANLVVCYIPLIVTDRQNMWIHNHEDLLQQNQFIGAFLIKEKANHKELETVNGLEPLIKVCDKRNLFYEKKEVEENARKKI